LKQSKLRRKIKYIFSWTTFNILNEFIIPTKILKNKKNG